MKEKYNIIRSADRYIEQRQYKKAIKVYQSLVESGERDPAVINDLGDLHARNGEQASALKCYVQAVHIYSEAGDSLKAVGLCRKILRLDPGNDEILDLFVDLNQKRDAEFESRSMLRELVQSALEAGEAARAAILQEKLVKVNPGNPADQLKLAEICFGIDRKNSSAEAVYRAADILSGGKDPGSSWNGIDDILSPMDPPDDFREFVEGLRGSYTPSSQSPVKEAGGAKTSPAPPPPPFQEEVLSSEFFEVESSPGIEESIEPAGETDEAADLKQLEEVFPEEISGEDGGLGEFALEEEKLSEETRELEETDEFEIEIDEAEAEFEDGDLTGTLEGEEEAAEKEAGAVSAEDVPLDTDETGNDYGPEGLGEDGSFELDLDQVEISSEELAALGIAGLEKESTVSEAGPEEEDRSAMSGVEGAAEDEAAAFDLEEEAESVAESSEEAEIPEDTLERPVEGIDEEPWPVEEGEGREEEEIESALDGIFVLGEGEAPVIPEPPEEIEEQEYQIQGRKGSARALGSSPGDPDEDPEVQMELGVAYREMGLTEDALGKFENALNKFEEESNDDKSVSCCLILAECSNILGKHKEALGWVARGLEYRKVPDEEVVDFEYESALALEALGDFAESLKGFRRIQSIQSDYKDVKKRISDLEASGH